MRKNLAFAFFVICLFSCNERLEENRKKIKQTNLSGISTHDVYFEKFLNIVEMDSLKGKIRSLLEWRSGAVQEQALAFNDYEKTSGKTQEEVKKILQVFGISGDAKQDLKTKQPAY